MHCLLSVCMGNHGHSSRKFPTQVIRLEDFQFRVYTPHCGGQGGWLGPHGAHPVFEKMGGLSGYPSRSRTFEAGMGQIA